VSINETSEQNSKGYCNVDFVFMLDQTNASFICGIKVIISIMNLYLPSECIPSALGSLSSLPFDMCSVCYLLCNNMQLQKWQVASQMQAIGTYQFVFGRNLYDTDETNSILEIRLTIYCSILEEIRSSFLYVANFLNLRVVS